MKLQDSPTLEEYTEGIPGDQLDSQNQPESGKRLWVVIGVLGFIILALFGYKLWQSDTFDVLTGKGVVSGYAVDENDSPITVEVFIFGSDLRVQSDETGYFEIQNVPIGEQSAIIAFGDIAVEVDVLVQAGVENQIGFVSVPTNLDTE